MSLLTEKLTEVRFMLMKTLSILNPNESDEQKLARKIVLIIEEYLFNLRKDNKK